jgi:cation transporter-like permease
MVEGATPAPTSQGKSKKFLGGALLVLLIVVLLSVLGVVLFDGSGSGDAQMSGFGVSMMIVGGIFTLVLGVVLMGMVFISARRGYDEGAGRTDIDDSPEDDDRPQ